MPLDMVRKPVLPQALEVAFVAVPFPKKAAVETLGGIAELTGAGADWTASSPADAPAGAPEVGPFNIAGAAAEDGDAVMVMVLLTVSVTVVPAAQPNTAPAPP